LLDLSQELVLGTILLSEGVDDVAIVSSALSMVHLTDLRVVSLQVSLDIGHVGGGERPGNVGQTLDFDDGASHEDFSTSLFDEASLYLGK